MTKTMLLAEEFCFIMWRMTHEKLMLFFFSDGIAPVCSPEDSPAQLGAPRCLCASPDPRAPALQGWSQSPAQPSPGTVPPRPAHPGRAQRLGMAVPPLGQGSRTAQGHRLEPWVPVQGPEGHKHGKDPWDRQSNLIPVFICSCSSRTRPGPTAVTPPWRAQPHCPAVSLVTPLCAKFRNVCPWLLMPGWQQRGAGYKSGREPEHISLVQDGQAHSAHR